MRLIFTLFIIIAIYLHAFSLENVNEEEAESRVNLFIEKGEKALVETPDTALFYADRALLVARTINFTSGIAHSLLLKGKALNAKNEFEDALIHLKSALPFTANENSLLPGNILYEQGYAFYRLGHSDSSIWYLEKALVRFDPTLHLEETARTEWRLALAYWSMGLFLDGLSHVQKSETLYEELNDTKRLVSVYNSKGAILWGLASYEKALEYFFNALSLNERENVNPDLNIILLNNIGLVYHDWEDNGNAMKYFKRAEALIPESNHPVGDAYTWLNIGTHFLRMDQTGTALEWLIKARDKYAVINDINGVCLSKIRIGECYQQNGDLKEAQETFVDAINDSRETNNKHREANALYYLAKNYLLQNDLDEAFKHSLLSLEISEKEQYKDITSLLYKQLSDLYEKEGNSSLALEMLSKTMTLKDDIYREKLAVQINLMDLVYENELKEAENSRLKSENLLKQRSLYFMYAAVLLIFLILIAISFFFLNLKKRKQELQDANLTKDKIFTIVAHDIRGPVGTLKSMIDLLVKEDHDFNYKEILQQFQPIVAGSFDMLENLLVWAKSNLGKLETFPVSLSLNKTIRETITLLLPLSEGKSINIRFLTESELQVKADKILLETVIRNLLKNAVKFTSENGQVTIRTRIDSRYAVIDIGDNGVGIPAEKQESILKGTYHTRGTQNEKGSGLGLMLSKELAEKNGGQLWFSSTEGEGSTFSFSVPLDPGRL